MTYKARPYLWTRQKFMGALLQCFFYLYEHFYISVHSGWIRKVKPPPVINQQQNNKRMLLLKQNYKFNTIKGQLLLIESMELFAT